MGKADECPLEQKCLTDNVDYKAKVTASRDGVCKERLPIASRADLEIVKSLLTIKNTNEKRSFRSTCGNYRGMEELSKKWSILKRFTRG